MMGEEGGVGCEKEEVEMDERSTSRKTSMPIKKTTIPAPAPRREVFRSP